MPAATKLVDVVRRWCRDTFRDLFVFTKSIFFTLGLIFSYKLVEKTFLNILITRLTDAWKNYDLRRAVVVVNLQEGTSAILVMFFVYAADVHTGRFKMVVFSTAVCIIGLLLNFMATAGEGAELDFGLFYPALGLMAMAQAAQTSALSEFLADQLRPTDSSAAADDDDAAWRRRSEFWWIFVSFVAAIFAQFGPLATLEFRKLAIVLTGVMGVCFFLFLVGTKYYEFVARIQNPFKDVKTVIRKAVVQRKVEYPQTPEELFHNPSGDLHIWPRVPWLRWIDRAAIVQRIQPSSPSTVEQVRKVKLLIKMLPLWSCFLTLSLVSASGSTFFFEEAIAIKDDLRLIIFFANLQRLTEFVVSKISSYVIRKLRERKQYNEQKMELVRIGIGMSCCVLCCITAWATAVRRQHDIEGNMSVYWLTPRYMLLGLMGGLSGDGLQLFYKSQVLESLFRFGPPFGEFMIGVGKYMSIVCVFIFSTSRFEWFASALDDSRLDKYYIFLAVLSLGNLIIYCLVACWYGDDASVLEGEEEEEEIGAIVEELVDEGQHVLVLPYLSYQTLRKAKEKSCRDDVAESSNSRQEEEETHDQDPLLDSKSTKNSTDINYVLLRAVTMFSRLSSRAARKRRLKNQ